MSNQAETTRKPVLPKVVRTSLKRTRRWVEEKLQQAYHRYNVAKELRAARGKLTVADGTYDKYLFDQLEETLRKKRLRGEVKYGVVPLIDMLGEKFDLKGKKVLCVGCRNREEILYFREKGAAEVIGIDLYSDHPDIVVMDMHELKFPDGRFDIVYSRHSFEHAFDKRKAGQEFVRVAKDGGVVVVEVPGKYKGGADYNRFDAIDDVMMAFEPSVGTYLRKEYSPKEENTFKMDIIRVMFHVDKKAGKSAPGSTAPAAR